MKGRVQDTPTTREIALDATNWKVPLDFYYALLPAIGAPDWHSASVASINDSMIGGGINALEPPYAVRVYNMDGVPAAVVEEVEYAVASFARVRASFCETHRENVEVSMEIVK